MVYISGEKHFSVFEVKFNKAENTSGGIKRRWK